MSKDYKETLQSVLGDLKSEWGPFVQLDAYGYMTLSNIPEDQREQFKYDIIGFLENKIKEEDENT
jgi:hypothetical protein